MPATDSLDAYLALSPEARQKVLSGLSPEAQQRLLTAYRERKSVAPAPQPSAPAVSIPTDQPGFFRGLLERILPSTDISDYVAGPAYAVQHPVESAKLLASSIAEGQGNEFKKGVEISKRPMSLGNLSEATGHFGASLLPVVGPAAAAAGETIGEGENIPYGLGQAAGTVGSVVAPELVGKGLSKVGQLRNVAREMVPTLTKSGPEVTTKPVVEKYIADSAKATAEHAAKDAEVTASNQQTVQRAANEARGIKAEFDQKVADAEAAHARKVAEANLANQEAARIAARKEELGQSLKQGHQQVGESIKEADAKLRVEGNEKYDAVRQATANDPGEGLSGVVEHAEKNILKGSPESIKTFKGIMDATGEGAELPKVQGMTPEEIMAHNPKMYEILKQQGIIGESGKIPFDQLQGFSSELGAKLASGNLAGDVYQAMKYVKEKVDAAKAAIAERNGVGPALADADHFWRNYMDTFYDKDSAVAKVRGNVGVKDPQFYAEPFTTGKSAEVGAAKLRAIQSRHAADLAQIADRALELRKTHGELKGMPNPKPVEVPEPPKPIPQPKQVAVQLKERPTLESPAPPTVEDIADLKKQAASNMGTNMAALKPRDLHYLGYSGIAFMTGHPAGVILGPLMFAAEKGLGRALNRPAVLNWIGHTFTEGDLAEIAKLPEPVQGQLRANLQNLIDQEAAKGKPPVVAPAVARAIGLTAAAQKIPSTRSEALDRLQSVQP